MKTFVNACLLALLLSSVQAQSVDPGQTALNGGPDVVAQVTRVKGLQQLGDSQVIPDAVCRSLIARACYSPQEIRNVYGLTPILNAGYTGAGQTIVIIDSFGSPTIAHDLHTFDTAFGLPDPPSFTVLSPLGTAPFDVTNPDQVGWAIETSLDVEWAHVMAPGANIVLLTSPVSETEGVQGMPEFLALEQYALDHKLGNIISQSWGATENSLFTPAGQQVLSDFESFYQRAAQESVTVLASTGDSGSSNLDVNGKYYPIPTVNFPASSPFVTAVGGTSLFADTSGRRFFEVVWSHPAFAGGGGVSQQFSAPSYQASLPAAVQKALNNHRGIPDVAYNADPFTSILVYVSFFPTPNRNGYYLIGGTSEGAPQWAGIVAVANQVAGRPLGFLNPKLYALGASEDASHLFHDIVFGSNALNGVPGYVAAPGWDLTTGWGTPVLNKLIPVLGSHGDE